MVRKVLFPMVFALAGGWLEAKSRVAVLPSPDLQEAGALLTAEMSASPEIEVMERAQFDALVQEKNLRAMLANSTDFSKIGQLLGVDALVFLDNPRAGSESNSARLVAVKPGVVVDEQSFGWPPGDAKQWAQILAKRLGTSLQNLPAEPKGKVLLGVLGLRSPLGGYLAREATFSVNRAVGHLPGVYAVDRQRLRDLDWEKQMAGANSTAFWKSAWLLDGNVVAPGRGLVLEGRLQPLTGGAAKTFRVEAADPAALGAAAAAEIASQLQTPVGEAAQATTGEADQFLEEARWAMRWKQYDNAERAADASWYLGNKSEEVGLIRATSAAMQAEVSVPGNFLLTNGEPPDGALESMGRALLNLRLVAMNGPPSARFIAEATTVLEQVSQLLRFYYYLSRERTDEERQQLRWIRKQVRTHVAKLAEASRAAFDALPAGQKNSLASWPDKPPLTFFIQYGWHAPLWNETPESSAQALTEALAAIGQLGPEAAAGLKKPVLTERGGHRPLVVAWEAADRARVPEVREKLLRDLGGKGPVAKLDALTLGAARYHLHSLPEFQRRVPREKLEAALADFYNGLVEMRGQIVDGTISDKALGHALELVAQIDNQEEYDKVRPVAARLKARTLLALFKENWRGGQGTANLLINHLVFTSQERDEIVRALESLPPDKKSAVFIDSYKERVTRQTDGAPPVAEAPPPSAPNGPEPAFRFRIAEEDEDWFGNTSVRYRNGLYFVGKGGGGGPVRYYQLDPRTGEQKMVVNSETDPAAVALGEVPWDVDDRRMYFTRGDKLFFLHRDTGRIELQVVPMLNDHVGQLRVAGGKLFAMSDTGSIVRIDPDTMEASLIASPQRRPAQTPLDDRKPSGPPEMFEAEGGVVFAVGAEAYVWDDGARTFRKLPQSLQVMPGVSYDRALFLKWIAAAQRGNGGYLMFVLDPGRTGSVPRMPGTWPPPLKLEGNEAFYSHVIDSTAEGSRLYIFFSGGKDRGNYVKIMGAQDTVVPLFASNPKKVALYDRISASEEGLLVWGRAAKELLFYKREDLLQPR